MGVQGGPGAAWGCGRWGWGGAWCGAGDLGFLGGGEVGGGAGSVGVRGGWGSGRGSPGRGGRHGEVETGRGVRVRAEGVWLGVRVWSRVRRVCGACAGRASGAAPCAPRTSRATCGFSVRGDGATGRRGDGATGRRGDGATGRRGDGATGRRHILRGCRGAGPRRGPEEVSPGQGTALGACQSRGSGRPAYAERVAATPAARSGRALPVRPDAACPAVRARPVRRARQCPVPAPRRRLTVRATYAPSPPRTSRATCGFSLRGRGCPAVRQGVREDAAQDLPRSAAGGVAGG
ncbi:hypothetical protein M2168_001233 [Streptomyces sp. CZ24]|nr:hypothetical protein [Streptomyces sp. CZ24]